MQAASRRRSGRLVVLLLVAALALPLVARAVATQWDDDVLWANAAKALGAPRSHMTCASS